MPPPALLADAPHHVLDGSPASGRVLPPVCAPGAPLERIDDLPVIWHGSRHPDRVLREGFDARPAITLQHAPEYAWRGMRDAAFCDGGGVNWAGPTWSWWMDLPRASRAAYRVEVGHPLRSADAVGAHVALIWGSTNRQEAESYARDGSAPLPVDPRRIPGILGAFMPDVSSKQEVVLVVRPTPRLPVGAALVDPARVAPPHQRGWRPL